MSKNSKTELKVERDAVLAFVLDCLEAAPDAKIFTDELFTVYMGWRKTVGLPPTVLSTDGFGKMLPKNYTKKLVYIDDVQGRGIEGVRVKA